MQTTRIGAWEFIREPSRLTYRLTASGLVPGAVMLILLALVFATWCYQTWRAASGPGSYLGCLVLATITLGCCYGLFHHLRSRFHPYVLDKRTDSFSNGYQKRCALSSMARVEVVRVDGVSGTHGPTRANHHIEFVLHNGETTSSYIACSTLDTAEQLSRQLQQFLDDTRN